MKYIKKIISTLEGMTKEDRLNSDEIDAVLMATSLLKGLAESIEEVEEKMFIDEEYYLTSPKIDIAERNTSFWVTDTHGNEREFSAIIRSEWSTARGVRDEDGEMMTCGYLCGNCGKWSLNPYHYCPHCGSDMKT